MRLHAMSFRPGQRDDALTVAALSIQVFLATYAADGVRPDLAREAFREYSEDAFLARLLEPGRRFVMAHAQSALVGFAEVACTVRVAPVQGILGFELARLYVQPQAQRAGLGTALLKQAEGISLKEGAPHLWLAAWEGNTRALAFYSRMGYADVGETVYVFEGREYENRVLTKRLAAA